MDFKFGRKKKWRSWGFERSETLSKNVVTSKFHLRCAFRTESPAGRFTLLLDSLCLVPVAYVYKCVWHTSEVILLSSVSKWERIVRRAKSLAWGQPLRASVIVQSWQFGWSLAYYPSSKTSKMPLPPSLWLHSKAIISLAVVCRCCLWK